MRHHVHLCDGRIVALFHADVRTIADVICTQKATASCSERKAPTKQRTRWCWTCPAGGEAAATVARVPAGRSSKRRSKQRRRHTPATKRRQVEAQVARRRHSTAAVVVATLPTSWGCRHRQQPYQHHPRQRRDVRLEAMRALAGTLPLRPMVPRWARVLAGLVAMVPTLTQCTRTTALSSRQHRALPRTPAEAVVGAGAAAFQTRLRAR